MTQEMCVCLCVAGVCVPMCVYGESVCMFDEGVCVCVVRERGNEVKGSYFLILIRASR